MSRSMNRSVAQPHGGGVSAVHAGAVLASSDGVKKSIVVSEKV